MEFLDRFRQEDRGECHVLSDESRLNLLTRTMSRYRSHVQYSWRVGPRGFDEQ